MPLTASKRKPNNISIRYIYCTFLSFVFFHLFINIFLDSLLNFYAHLHMVSTIQVCFYSIIICLSAICLLMVLTCLYLNENSNPIANKFIFATNMIFSFILTLHFVFVLNGFFYKYWSEKWITIMYFSSNLFLALILFIITLLYLCFKRK
jgi:hypothetical protein